MKCYRNSGIFRKISESKSASLPNFYLIDSKHFLLKASINLFQKASLPSSNIDILKLKIKYLNKKLKYKLIILNKFYFKPELQYFRLAFS